LADRLVDCEHPVHALWVYEQTRLPMTAEIVQMNRRGGPEGVIDAVEARAPEGFSNIDDVLSFEQRKAIVRGYASAAGFAREQVNKAA
jgi:5-methylphenazine-1-carboxylate 1-monooxygenase